MNDFILPKTLSNTVITDKNVVYQGGDLELNDVTFDGGAFEVRGDAADGVNFMKAIFNAGAKKAVMLTFLNDEEYEIVKNTLGWEGVDGSGE